MKGLIFRKYLNLIKNSIEAFSNSMLKYSHLRTRILHKNSINVIFYDGLCCLVLRTASSLDAFSSYPHIA